MTCTHFKVQLPITDKADKHLLISNWTFVGQTQINHETIDVLTENIFPATCSYRHLQSNEKPGMNVDSCWMARRLRRRAGFLTPFVTADCGLFSAVDETCFLQSSVFSLNFHYLFWWFEKCHVFSWLSYIFWIWGKICKINVGFCFIEFHKL